MFLHNDVILAPTPHPPPTPTLEKKRGGGVEEINEGYIYRERQTDRQKQRQTDKVNWCFTPNECGYIRAKRDTHTDTET